MVFKVMGVIFGIRLVLCELILYMFVYMLASGWRIGVVLNAPRHDDTTHVVV